MTLPRFSRGLNTLLAAAVIAATTSTWAQTMPEAPASIPALPAGHPAMPANSATGMPAGHPAMPANGATTMSADPLSMEQLMGNTGTQPSNLTGSLAITVVPASATGGSTANEAVTVELSHRGAPIKKMEFKTDGLGKLTVPGIPLMPPVDIVVSIMHAGLLQQAMAPGLSVEAPSQSIEMKVYEPTEEQPAWTIAMQHMIVQWGKDGNSAVITEMLSANTSGDKAWIGNKTADGKGRVTLTVPIPPGADQIVLGGNFDEDLSKLVDGKLVTASPLFPGRSEFRMTYTVPAPGGKLDLPIVAPAAVGNLIVFLPADDSQVKVTGLGAGQTVDMGGGEGGAGGGKVRMYRAENLAAGATASLAITGIKPAPAAVDDGTMPAKSPLSARNVAIGGAFLLVLAGAALMLIKKPQPRKD